MINVKLAKVGMTVYIQNKFPEYGTITKIERTKNVLVIFVHFTEEPRPRPVNPEKLNWPPYFCARDDNKPGQIYDYEWTSGHSDTIPILKPEDLI